MSEGSIDVHVHEDAHRAVHAMNVRVRHQLDAAPTPDEEVSPIAEDHRRQVLAGAFGEVGRNVVRDGNLSHTPQALKEGRITAAEALGRVHLGARGAIDEEAGTGANGVGRIYGLFKLDHLGPRRGAAIGADGDDRHVAIDQDA